MNDEAEVEHTIPISSERNPELYSMINCKVLKLHPPNHVTSSISKQRRGCRRMASLPLSSLPLQSASPLSRFLVETGLFLSHAPPQWSRAGERRKRKVTAICRRFSNVTIICCCCCSFAPLRSAVLALARSQTDVVVSSFQLADFNYSDRASPPLLAR